MRFLYHIIYFISFFSLSFSMYGMINYNKIMEQYRTALLGSKLEKLFLSTDGNDPVQQNFQATIVMAQYLIQKYNSDGNCIFYSIGGSPALLIPCCQFLDPEHWSLYQHAAFSGGWYPIKEMSRTSNSEPTEEQEHIFRTYLEKIGLHPKNIVEGKNKFLFFDLMISGQGTRSFLSMLFRWIADYYPEKKLETLFTIVKDKISIVGFPEHYFVDTSLQKTFTDSLPLKDFIFEQCAPDKQDIPDESLSIKTPYTDFIGLCIFISGSEKSNRLIPSFKKEEWSLIDPLTYEFPYSIKLILYKFYLEIKYKYSEKKDPNEGGILKKLMRILRSKL